WRVWQVRLAYGTLSESPQRGAMTLLSPSFPALGPPMPETCWRSSDLGTHGERADGGPSVYQQTRGPVRPCLTVGERSLTPARAAGGDAGWRSPPDGPGGTADSARRRCL